MAETEKIQFHRPANNDDFKQTKAEKDMMSYIVLYGCSNSAAYALFNRHLLDKNGKLNKAGQSECRMFFSHPNNIAYMDALRAHLSTVTKGGGVVKATDDSDSRKDNALKVLVNRALSLMEHGEDLDPETIKLIADIAVKLKLVKEEQQEVEKPRRYLPARCRTECAYRLFVESHIEGGEIVQECDYCRTRKFAEENGWHFDPTKNLDLPTENNE
jgi:hypothetical protein